MKAQPGPAAATSTPPRAGPTARPTFMLALLSTAAWGICSRGTSCGWSACQAGRRSASPIPTTSVSPSSDQAPILSASVRPARRPAAATASSWLAMSRRRRSTMSPSAPAGSASSTTGRLIAVWTSATISAECSSVTISHCAATVCIQVPTFDSSCAANSSRNGECLRGASDEGAWRSLAATPAYYPLNRQPALVEAAHRRLGQPDRVGDRAVVDVLRNVARPVVVRRLLEVRAGAEHRARVAGGEGVDAVGGVPQPQVGVELDPELVGQTVDQGEGLRGILPHPEHALAAQHQEVGRAKRVEAEEEGALGRQRREVAAREVVHPLACRLLRGRQEDDAYPLGRAFPERAREREERHHAGAVVVGAGHGLARADLGHGGRHGRA